MSDLHFIGNNFENIWHQKLKYVLSMYLACFGWFWFYILCAVVKLTLQMYNVRWIFNFYFVTT